MKKIISSFLTFAIIFALLPMGILEFDAKAATDGYYTYSVLGGEATITDVDQSISGNITIPSTLGGYPVTSIGSSAFYNCSALTSITIPSSVTSIGSHAFYWCDALTSITIPDSVTSIGSYAFYSCESLTNVTIGNGVESIGDYAFHNCSTLGSINIPDSVTNIGSEAFSFCSALESITIPSSVTSIGDYAFAYCDALESITIGNRVTSIGERAFYDCDAFYSITIPDSVTSIGSYAFSSCDALTSVTIGNSVTSIGSYAFSSCDALERVYYRGSQQDRQNISIGSNNAKLTSATWYYNACVGSAEHTYDNNCDTECNICKFIRVAPHVYDNNCDAFCNVCSYERTPEVHVKLDYTFENDITYPFSLTDGVYSSTNKAHNSTSTATLNVLADGEIKIEYYTSTENSCDKLTIKQNSTTKVTASGNTAWTSVTINAKAGDVIYISYSKDGSMSSGSDEIKFKLLLIPAENFEPTCEDAVICAECGITVKEALGHTYLYDCTPFCDRCGKEKRTPPAPHTYTNDYDTKCNVCSLTRVIEPKTVVVNGVSYYITPSDNGGTVKVTGCETTVFGSLTIESQIEGYDVVSINAQAFKDCNNISSIKIPTSVTTIENQAFSGCTGLLELEIPFLNGRLGSLFGTVQYGEISNEVVPLSLKKVTVLGGEIPAYSFENCDSISTIVLGDGVTKVGQSAFRDCNSITVVTIGNGAKTIESEAFFNCISLTRVTIGNGTEIIKESAFEYCISLATIKIGNGTKTIGPAAFKDCFSLYSVITGDDITLIDASAFMNCKSLESFDFPAKLEQIGNSVFAYCTALDNVVIPNKTILIGSYAFSGCTAITNVTIGESVTTIFDAAFLNCSKLEAIILPSSTTSIGESAFENCTSLKRAVIKGRTDHINNSTFENCTSLETLAFPKNVNSIAYNAFNNCTSLSKVWYEGTEQELAEVAIAYGNDSIKKATWSYGEFDTVGHIYDNACDAYCNICDAKRSVKAHSYTSATCTNPKTCNVCGKTSGSKLGHTYSNDCDTTCNRCGAKRTISHSYKAATCTAPKTCKVCKATSGKALGHNYKAATCTAPKTCKVCKATSGKALGHKYTKVTTVKATTSKNGYVLTECSVCGKDKSKTTIYYAKSIKLSKTSYTYDGKTKKPSVVVKDSKGKTISSKYYTVSYASGRKSVGKYKVTIKFKGNYSGTKTLYFTINPAKTSLKKVTGASKSLKVSINKKTTQVTGYEIQYSTSKKFTKPKTVTVKSAKTTSATIKKLKAKTTYYVRVRTYKTVSGKKYYSGWSSYKSAKTK